MTRDPLGHRSLRAARRAAHPLPVQECFADEVAIDFPSVGRVVERMRDAFLREDAGSEELETELRLSTIEARRGLVVPLDVPMRSVCPSCNGRGGTWRDRCERCAGTGESLYHHHVHVSVPPGVANGARFRFRVSSPLAAAPVRVELRVAVHSPAA